jgi:hypothetical protein
MEGRCRFGGRPLALGHILAERSRRHSREVGLEAVRRRLWEQSTAGSVTATVALERSLAREREAAPSVAVEEPPPGEDPFAEVDRLARERRKHVTTRSTSPRETARQPLRRTAGSRAAQPRSSEIEDVCAGSCRSPAGPPTPRAGSPRFPEATAPGGCLIVDDARLGGSDCVRTRSTGDLFECLNDLGASSWPS